MDSIIVFKTYPAHPYLSYDEDGFVRTAAEAFTNHYGLIIRPDNVWVTILAQVALYISFNSDKLRTKFVDFEGKKELISFGHIQNAPGKLLNLVHENIKDKEFKDWVLTEFSTSTDNDQLVKGLMMLGIFKKYFDYAITACGLRRIIIKGSEDDWLKILNNLEKLKELDFKNNTYDIKKWHSNLHEFIFKFVEVKRRIIDRKFWNSFVGYSSPGSGSPAIYGPILALSEFFLDYEERLIQLQGRRLDIGSLPPEYVEIKIKDLDVPNHTYVIRAGNMGFTEHNSNFLANVRYILTEEFSDQR